MLNVAAAALCQVSRSSIVQHRTCHNSLARPFIRLIVSDWLEVFYAVKSQQQKQLSTAVTRLLCLMKALLLQLEIVYE